MSNKTPRKLPEETESAPKPETFQRKSFLFTLVILLALVISIFSMTKIASDEGNMLQTPKGRISLEVADSPTERSKGLSGRESVNDRFGLLFVFEEASLLNCFWMKEMKFSIDMIWLNENKKVITVMPNVLPETYPHTFCPTSDAKYGLEIKAGESANLGISVGKELGF